MSFNDINQLYNVIGTTFSGVTLMPLRPKYPFDALAVARTWDLNSSPSKGDAVTFPVLGAWAANTAAMDSTTTDYSGGSVLAYTRKSIALSPYGNYSVYDTEVARMETFSNEISDMAFQLADQGMNSINLVCRTVMDLNRFSNGVSGTLSATSGIYASSGTVSTMGALKAKDVRAIVSSFKDNKVQPYTDGFFYAVITPSQKTQLRADSDAAGWTESAKYNANGDMLKINGDLGVFEGVRFIESSECKKLTNTHFGYFLGQDAIGKAIGKDMSVKTNPTLAGPYGNLLTMSWTALLGYKVLRSEALIVIQSKSVKR